MKKMVFGAVIEGQKKEFTIELDPSFVDDNGVVRQTGRDQLRVAIISTLRAAFPDAPLDALERAAEMALPDCDLPLPKLKLAMHVRAVKSALGRAARLAGPTSEQLMHFAQEIDRQLSEPGAHIYSCGQASARVNAAVELLCQAMVDIENLATHLGVPVQNEEDESAAPAAAATIN